MCTVRLFPCTLSISFTQRLICQTLIEVVALVLVCLCNIFPVTFGSTSVLGIVPFALTSFTEQLINCFWIFQSATTNSWRRPVFGETCVTVTVPTNRLELQRDPNNRFYSASDVTSIVRALTELAMVIWESDDLDILQEEFFEFIAKDVWLYDGYFIAV